MGSKSAAARKQPEPAEVPAGIIYIPLNKLLLSPGNVRKTGGDEDIESLAASIHAPRLIHNLVVTAAPGGQAGLYEVDAGGRRWRALQLLVMQRKIARNMPIACKVEERDQATETSLAENIDRIMMNPADEAEAYATIVARYAEQWVGGDLDARGAENERIAHCARRFGVTERHVRQRLRLADLAPEILTALRENLISLDVARAYASVSDRSMQLQVWKQEKQRGGNDAKTVRDKLAGRIYTTDHRAVRYIGVEAYEEAGGRVEPDLFFGAEDGLVLLDPSIVDRLVATKAAEQAHRLAQEEGFLDGLVKPWSGPSYAEPKAPEGYVRQFSAKTSMPEEKRGAALVAYQLADGEDDTVILSPVEYDPAWVKIEPKPVPPTAPAIDWGGPSRGRLSRRADPLARDAHRSTTVNRQRLGGPRILAVRPLPRLAVCRTGRRNDPRRADGAGGQGRRRCGARRGRGPLRP